MCNARKSIDRWVVDDAKGIPFIPDGAYIVLHMSFRGKCRLRAEPIFALRAGKGVSCRRISFHTSGILIYGREYRDDGRRDPSGRTVVQDMRKARHLEGWRSGYIGL